MHETAEQYRQLATGARAMAIRSAPPQSGVYREEAAAYERMAELAERQGRPEPVKEQCGSCKYFREEQRDCRRYPPVRVDHYISYFPATNQSGWCGEWQKAEKS